MSDRELLLDAARRSSDMARSCEDRTTAETLFSLALALEAEAWLLERESGR
jgi:hypothetical protein